MTGPREPASRTEDADLRSAFPPSHEPPFRTPVPTLTTIAVRRGRRRRLARQTLGAGGVVVLAALALVAARVTVGSGSPRELGPAAGRSGGASPPATSTPSSSPPVPCQDRQLQPRIARSGSQASQSYAQVLLTNRSAEPCQLSGYPDMDAWGAPAGGRQRRLPIQLTHGPLYVVRDPGPSSLTLQPGRSAWFAVGTGTAYGPALTRVTRIVLHLHPSTATSDVSISTTLDATAPSGKRLPVTVTAFAPGQPPHP